MSYQQQQYYCPRCNAPIHLGQRFCSNCALPLDPASLNAFFASQRGQQPAPPHYPQFVPPQAAPPQSAPPQPHYPQPVQPQPQYTQPLPQQPQPQSPPAVPATPSDSTGSFLLRRCIIWPLAALISYFVWSLVNELIR